MPHGVPHQFLEVTDPYLLRCESSLSDSDKPTQKRSWIAALLVASGVRVGGRALNARSSCGRPYAVVDLASREGVQLVSGQWATHNGKLSTEPWGPGLETERCSRAKLRLRASRRRCKLRRFAVGSHRCRDTRSAAFHRKSLLQLVQNQRYDPRKNRRLQHDWFYSHF